VALRGRITVDVQTFHAPPGLDTISAFCGAPRSSPTMLLCQHLGWEPWGRKVCCGRRGSARAKRIEAKRPHCHHGREHRPDLRLRPGLYRERTPLPRPRLRPYHFHDLGGYLSRGARSVVRGALRRAHLQHHRAQAVPRAGRAGLRGVRGACRDWPPTSGSLPSSGYSSAWPSASP
jgi:hypothetical protein